MYLQINIIHVIVTSVQVIKNIRDTTPCVSNVEHRVMTTCTKKNEYRR
jgi:hypothetical protein